MTAPKNRNELRDLIVAALSPVEINRVERANAILDALEASGCAVVPVKMTDAWRVKAQEWADDGYADLYNYPLEDGFKAALFASPYRKGGDR